MKFSGYKHLLQEINKDRDVIVKLSIWKHHGKRMIFTVPLEQISNCIDNDMIFKCNRQKLKLTTGNGKTYSFILQELRIAKVDSVEIKEKEQ